MGKLDSYKESFVSIRIHVLYVMAPLILLALAQALIIAIRGRYTHLLSFDKAFSFLRRWVRSSYLT